MDVYRHPGPLAIPYQSSRRGRFTGTDPRTTFLERHDVSKVVGPDGGPPEVVAHLLAVECQGSIIVEVQRRPRPSRLVLAVAANAGVELLLLDSGGLGFRADSPFAWSLISVTNRGQMTDETLVVIDPPLLLAPCRRHRRDGHEIDGHKLRQTLDRLRPDKQRRMVNVRSVASDPPSNFPIE